jgi:C1A family cysteine protease
MSASTLEHHYGGWRPSLPDPRDVRADPSQIRVLEEVDPRARMPSVYDQGSLGSCTANAVAAAVEYDRRLNVDHTDDYTPSRLDIYYGERVLERSPIDQDIGAYGRDGFKFAQRTGVIPESKWPYDVSRFAERPPQDVPRRRIGAYKVVARSVASFQAVLSNRQTIAIGFSVFESFESVRVASIGVMPIPDVNSERLLGGHEVLVVGYLKNRPNYWLVRNSWGSGWGLGGYFLMPIAITMDRSMSGDFRTIYRPLVRTTVKVGASGSSYGVQL